jgi:hypothetical protein
MIEAAPFEARIGEGHPDELEHVLLGGSWVRNVVEFEGFSWSSSMPDSVARRIRNDVVA